jgi:hypothetical protein
MVYSPLQGRLAQRESAAFTRQRSLVRAQHRPLKKYGPLQEKYLNYNFNEMRSSPLIHQ